MNMYELRERKQLRQQAVDAVLNYINRNLDARHLQARENVKAVLAKYHAANVSQVTEKDLPAFLADIEQLPEVPTND
jgi:hypothetical protein